MITLAQFKKFLPKNKYADQWYAALCGPQDEFGGSSLLDEYDINTPKRIAAFLAQCGHESGGFVFLTENLNYKAAGLRRVFPNYFKTDEIAASYERKPEKIANRVYANRMGNGDESSGDGYRYCGRGLIQLTGRNNYQAFADSLEINIQDVPAYLGTFEGAAQSACWFWETNRLNRFVDANDFKGLTKAINGGYIGLEDREHHYEVALSIFSSDTRLA
jgi:putative chitinase